MLLFPVNSLFLLSSVLMHIKPRHPHICSFRHLIILLVFIVTLNGCCFTAGLDITKNKKYDDVVDIWCLGIPKVTAEGYWVVADFINCITLTSGFMISYSECIVWLTFYFSIKQQRIVLAQNRTPVLRVVVKYFLVVFFWVLLRSWKIWTYCIWGLKGISHFLSHFSTLIIFMLFVAY